MLILEKEPVFKTSLVWRDYYRKRASLVLPLSGICCRFCMINVYTMLP